MLYKTSYMKKQKTLINTKLYFKIKDYKGVKYEKKKLSFCKDFFIIIIIKNFIY